jgi:hypothetical protein
MEQQAYGVNVKSHTVCHGHTIHETVDGIILVDRIETEHSSIEEAVEQIRHQKLSEDIQLLVQQEAYDQILDIKIADIIKEHHNNIKTTDTLIESYIELASSKLFTLDPVVHDIKRINKLDRLIENRFDYVLDDGSVVVISEETQQRINNIFKKHQDIVEYMRESKENFLDVLNQLGDE